MNTFNLLPQNDILEEIVIDSSLKIGYYIFSIVVSIVFFIIKAIAIYTMAKRRNFDKLWMAFVPFLNYILLGKLAGKAIVWGKEIKNIGLVVCILSAVSLIGGYVLYFGYYLALLGLTVETTSAFISSWISQTGIVFSIFDILLTIIDFINLFLTVSLALLIFRKYYPERAFMYMIISIFFEFMFGILLFTIRNKDYLTYEDYLRSRQNHYNQGNPYNRYNGYNGYTVYNGGENIKPEDDPFPEFSTNNNSSEPFGEFNNASQSDNNTNSESKNSSTEDDLFN